MVSISAVFFNIGHFSVPISDSVSQTHLFYFSKIINNVRDDNDKVTEGDIAPPPGVWWPGNPGNPGNTPPQPQIAFAYLPCQGEGCL